MKYQLENKKTNGFIRSKLNTLWSQYKHAIPLLTYMVFYLSWWKVLEKKVTTDYQVIHMGIDDYIPFCEWFVIPYFLWFAYVSVTVLLLFFKDRDKRDYYRCLAFLFTGMTLFLLISTVMPNGHHLRLAEMPRDNTFTRMIAALWRSDTPTNLWPSIHVYNSLGAHFAITRSKAFQKYKVAHIASLILAVSIILSTMLIKQHSVFDVITALVMASMMYILVYRRDLLPLLGNEKDIATI